MLDGAARIGDLLDAAVADGQPAIAITDHGNLYGTLEFYKAARARGIKPIIGLEAYMAASSRFERPQRRGRIDDTGGESDRGEKLYYHLTLLATSNQGYHNLIQLSSRAFLESYYYKPRIDFELLNEHREGIIALTGCLGGLVLQHLLRGDEEGARRVGSTLREILGPENLFVELQDHGLAEQRRTNPQLIELARYLGVRTVATNDSHYTHREDHEIHDALLCVQTGSIITDANRFRFEGSEHYLKSAREMRELFAELPEACDATLEIAERCEVEITFGHPALPEIDIPARIHGERYEDRAGAYLAELVWEGARCRYGDPVPEHVGERIGYELSVIADMGFPGYFLVVWDLIRHARESGIRVGPGRGSAAGSVVAYCLGITQIDPLRYDLLFERFLNPGRRQMPDIDMDFDERYRGEMIRYAAERYGADHVAQIITFSTIKARAAVRDAARVLGYPYALGDRIAKAMPPLVMGRDTPLAACLELTPGYEDGYQQAAGLREMVASDPDVARVVGVAKGLEGLRRQDGIHAAAVVISREPLTTYLPIQRKPDPGQDPSEAPIVTQFEMHGVEELGLLKMDFLGLRTLSVIDRAVELIRTTRGIDVDIDRVPLDDERTYELLRAGDTVGVFQLEGGPMRQLMRQLAPTRFEDVAALVALYRPGPMAANMHVDYAERKNGRQPVTYLHPDLEPVLADTWGLMIYQESVMRVAQHIAGYSLAEADNLRKACGKKIRELIAKEREKFIAGCVTNGYDATLGTALFDIIEPFADYAFNKSHAFGYGLVSYQTAYLKANYPVQYLAAVLTSVRDDKDKMAVYLADAAAHHIDVLVPDVNASELDFSVTRSPDGREQIRFGLAAIRNVGDGLVRLILEERERQGPFQSFADFLVRVDAVVLNRRTMESLIKAGAFDSFGHPRRGLLEALDAALERASEQRRLRERGLGSLFDDPDETETTAPDFRVEVGTEEWPTTERLTYEREMLGLYVSSHPMDGVPIAKLGREVMPILDLLEAESPPSEAVTVVGAITALTQRTTRRGELMATLRLEDLGAGIEVMVFPKTMADYGVHLAQDAIVAITGRIDGRDEVRKLVALSIEPINTEQLATEPDPTAAVVVHVPRHLAVPASLRQLREVFLAHEGPQRAVLDIDGMRFEVPAKVKVGSSLVGHLRNVFGDQVRVG